jgi:hypothetical protein
MVFHSCATGNGVAELTWRTNFIFSQVSEPAAFVDACGDRQMLNFSKSQDGHCRCNLYDNIAWRRMQWLPSDEKTPGERQVIRAPVVGTGGDH